ncbi:YqaJ viral recombinase family protein [Sphingomonas sp. RB1R13]|uniref:YqaJ viral recombinase family protein n=1 Tax=Sphingomonas sp. RB1R13 TaxID=3096159 RepID=UPI002FCC405A
MSLLLDNPLDVRSYEAKTVWPTLGATQLSLEDRKMRLCGLGGSDANTLLSGDADRILRLWQLKRQEIPEEDLSDRLQVALGSWTEPFNRQWYEKISGQSIVDAGLSVTCKKHSWRRCLLDGIVENTNAVFEAKHTGAFVKSEEVLERYMPQLQHNMAVADCETAVLSVIFGNHKYEIFEIAADWLYQLELLEAEEEFWDCVQTGRAPVAPPVPLPPKPVGVREVCLEGNNSWASAAIDWLEDREAAKRHAAACGTIKALVETDVARAFGHGIEARRSKSGALSIRELGQ